MRAGARYMAVVSLILLQIASAAKFACAQNFRSLIFPEQRSIEVRDPSELPRARIPDIPPPATVANLHPNAEPLEISLDDAIRIALANSEVIRVLTGVSAASSGRTIYDAAIANTVNDQQRGRFDPELGLDNGWNRFEPPAWNNQTGDFTQASTDEYRFGLGLSKTTTSGGTMRLGVDANPQRFTPGDVALNPQTRSSLDLSYTQPLLQGGGGAANLAPLVLARIDTERSYFQFKDSVQELVRGVIEAYWALVFARTDLWARERQVEQAAFAFRLAEARFEFEITDVRNKSQAQVSLQNFRSSQLSAQDSVLQREAALRNIMGLPPTDGRKLVPVTPPARGRYQATWDELVQLAEQQRPDLIELKLILEADQQRLLQARNEALPRLDAVALYRWNGLEGEIPNGGGHIATQSGRYTDWNLGVNFSVPLGLRRERALLRQQELIIARDRANLQQGLHSVIHVLAQDLRNLELLYERYKLANETREPALINLNAHAERWRTGSILFVEVLLAITDWGNNISSEAQYLAQYNTQLANLERNTGTILETHGICFYEERFGAIGPLGRWHHDRCYPEAVQPGENTQRYSATEQPAEQFFDLRDPIGERSRRTEEIPPPARRLPAPEPTPSAIGPLTPTDG